MRKFGKRIINVALGFDIEGKELDEVIDSMFETLDSNNDKGNMKKICINVKVITYKEFWKFWSSQIEKEFGDSEKELSELLDEIINDK